MFNLTRHRLFKMAASVLLSFTLLFVSSVQPALALVSSAHQYPVDNIDGIIADVPTGERWLQHLEEDLLPFWTMDEALGDPVGNYPTYRCNDGSLYSWRNSCPEIENADSSIVKPDR